MPATVSPAELADALKQSDTSLIDVRTPVEFQEVHVRGARNVPLDRLKPADFQGRDQKLYVICKSGSRAAKACDQLSAAGITNVVNVEGGTQACVEAGLPVNRGEAAMSLERQVRIAAGTLVVIGTVLGALVHPYWLGLSGFVGAGLVFAGITDTCGMGMLLARMPWNQVGKCRTNSPTKTSATS
ncbi:rhodanese-like domain-containing protein [Botrimarina mediterranea]|uniref:Inner membrane protein YgaP n=1 Tax=Botrimarina mediterranea TaxID=2528022 RepID=A0A518K255_9BACT|nr:rhodanese-like domain-containing protein [Botrimarina mediterranea]QDV71849.1 Inner membrane protein YgaP [Botrimarina mediterranea]QDV76440.1 Inner membrane protein YgaP [Planctomycetes bacterium K2D]